MGASFRLLFTRSGPISISATEVPEPASAWIPAVLVVARLLLRLTAIRRGQQAQMMPVMLEFGEVPMPAASVGPSTREAYAEKTGL